MRVACFYQGSNAVALAFAAGVRKMGDSAEVFESNNYPGSGGYDIAAFYGMSPRHEAIFNDFRAHGKSAIAMDLGYWGRRTSAMGYGYLKVSVNSLHPTAYFQKVRHPIDRFSVFSESITPMRKGGSHILLAGIGPKSSIYYRMQHQAWDKWAVAEIRKFTKRTIVYRAKPHHEKKFTPIPGTIWADPTISIANFLKDAWCVVTHHSNVAVNGVVMGIPCFTKEGVARSIGLYDLSQIEDPRILSQEEQNQFIADVAYTQWSLAEMTQGYCWSHLRKEVLL